MFPILDNIYHYFTNTFKTNRMNEYDKIIIKAGIVLFSLTALMMAFLIFKF